MFTNRYEERTNGRGKFHNIIVVPIMFVIGYFIGTGLMGLFL